MTVSAQFLILYSVALAVVSAISTMFFVQTHSLHKRAMNWYGSRIAGLNQRWHSLDGVAGDRGSEDEGWADPDDDPRVDLEPPDADQPDPGAPDLFDQAPDPEGADVIIRDLVAALTPESLTSVTSRMPASDSADLSWPARAVAVIPSARVEQGLAEVAADEQAPAESEPTRTVTHAPQLQPASEDYINPPQAIPAKGGPDSQRNDPGHWWNGTYRGRHEAELLIYPTAPFPLVVRGERDGGSRR